MQYILFFEPAGPLFVRTPSLTLSNINQQTSAPGASNKLRVHLALILKLGSNLALILCVSDCAFGKLPHYNDFTNVVDNIWLARCSNKCNIQFSLTGAVA